MLAAEELEVGGEEVVADGGVGGAGGAGLLLGYVVAEGAAL